MGDRQVDDPEDCQQRIDAQRPLIGDIKECLEEEKSNSNVSGLLQRLQQYQDILENYAENWYTISDDFEALNNPWTTENKRKSWHHTLVTYFNILRKRHFELQQQVQPRQPERKG